MALARKSLMAGEENGVDRGILPPDVLKKRRDPTARSCVAAVAGRSVALFQIASGRAGLNAGEDAPVAASFNQERSGSFSTSNRTSEILSFSDLRRPRCGALRMPPSARRSVHEPCDGRMSENGPSQIWRDVRLESAKHGIADIASGFRPGRFMGARPSHVNLKFAA